jgi:hypothetical protein
MKTLLISLIVLIGLMSCQKDDITPTTHRLRFTVTPSAVISWGVNELQFTEKSGGYFEQSLTIKSGQTFIIEIDSPSIPTPRTVEIYLDNELVLSDEVHDKTIRYLIK